RRYDNEDMQLGEVIASRAALAMHNALLYRKAQQALSTRDEVLAVVSHDLRNPLQTINLGLQLLQTPGMDETQQERNIERIVRAKDRMDRLIRDLLDVARVEGGKTLLVERQRGCPSTFLRDARESFLASAEEHHVQLGWRVPDDLPDVFADQGRILQVL